MTIGVSGCTAASVTAQNGNTVGAIANPVGQNDAQCVPDDPTDVVNEVSFCQLPMAGSCPTAGQACLPSGRSLSCVMLSGDVACSAPYTDRRVYFADTNATTCTCSCGGGRQTCPTDDHYHANLNGVCNGTKFDVVGDGGCKNTGLTTVNSLNNHPAVLTADDATCVDQSAPSGNPAAMTVCCMP